IAAPASRTLPRGRNVVVSRSARTEENPGCVIRRLSTDIFANEGRKLNTRRPTSEFQASADCGAERSFTRADHEQLQKQFYVNNRPVITATVERVLLKVGKFAKDESNSRMTVIPVHLYSLSNEIVLDGAKKPDEDNSNEFHWLGVMVYNVDDGSAKIEEASRVPKGV
ncbi:unnamed protein product, partial [Soboliphyme baturini]|uniref:ULP_PROTEASE domain-containing protein n=1 Tax=Soboliphyme baturini TaxID=241478 RepID=A0A183JAS8_9BILA